MAIQGQDDSLFQIRFIPFENTSILNIPEKKTKPVDTSGSNEKEIYLKYGIGVEEIFE